MRTLYRGADILTVGKSGEPEIIRNGYLGIDGKTIDYVGASRPETTYEETRDFTHKLLIPGLINAHSHAPMTLLRGLGSDKPLQVWLNDFIFPVEDRLRPEDIRRGTSLALLEMLATGTTSFSDMYYECDEIIDACLESGIKANIARPVQCFDPTEPYAKNYRAKQSFDLYRRRNGDGDGRILIDFSIHAEYTCTESVVRGYSEECKSYRDAGMHIHLSETKEEHDTCVARYGKTPAKWFYDLGTFDTRTFAAHCVYVTDRDIALMKEKGVSVVHNPTSNMKLGSGFADVEHYRKSGLNVALGTDGAASNNNLNMFEEIHLASVIHNGYQCNPEIMKPADIIRMATENGALLQRRKNTGKLLPSYCADIVAIDMDKPHLFPNPDSLAMLCYSVQGSDVAMTMVDGKVLYENGEYKTLDRDRILFEAKESCRHLYGE